MRIVIDLQAAQTENRKRGIGRYSLSLALAMARNRGGHEVLIALNGCFPNTVETIREAFSELLPLKNIRVWHAAGAVAHLNHANDWRRKATELVREAFLASLRPDIAHVSSLFEGFAEDAVTSIGMLSRNIPTAVTLYDLIPFIHRKLYLENPIVEAWYSGKIEHLRRADLWLAISESSRREGVDYLGLPDERSVNISSAADAHFHPLKISTEAEAVLRQKYGLSRAFMMYTGGIDHRKNIERLITAFTKLPAGLRKAYQLAIVCSVQPDSRRKLERLAIQQGLDKDEFILTGFVPDEDLHALYNLCALFVFPSWHEGFGLPALEAMRCGAPVIGANTSSLPEVIGWEEALFNPYSDEAIAAAIERALSDEAFRTKLVSHGKTQAEKFSWDKTARKVIGAMESFHAERQAIPQAKIVGDNRPRLAYVSPLPPEKSGIADYSAELLPELARLYKIDVIVAQDTISDSWIKANCPIHTAQWFIENAERYERVLYHVGNSIFHGHMFGLLKAIPGVVLLHDFFLSGIACHVDVHGIAPGYWSKELYRSHGYRALCDRFQAKDIADVVWKYPCSLSVIQDSLGVIVHSPYSLRLLKEWYSEDPSGWSVIPLLRDSRISGDKGVARDALGFEAGDFLVCAFGILGPIKLNHRLLRAWMKSRLVRDKKCHLVFVGENDAGEYGRECIELIRHNQMQENIRITGWADAHDYRQYLAAADVGVQLRTLSRGETSAAVLDCMNYGLATIVNANGSMADLDEKAVWKLPDKFCDEQLTEALETLWQDEACRHRLGGTARSIILRDHSPRICAERYGEVLERFYQVVGSSSPALPRAIAAIHGCSSDDSDLIQMADAVANSFPQQHRKPQLLVDISELVQRDARSGIQRVVRSILSEWLHAPPTEYRVEPIYATMDRGYQYARHFTLGFLGLPDEALKDEPIEYAPGDVFVGLDLQPQVALAQRAFYQALRQQGVKVMFTVYDLLCVQTPQYFMEGSSDSFIRWLKVIAESDGAVCISKAVADELADWVKENGPARRWPFIIDWFHLGADMDNSTPTKGFLFDSGSVLDRIRSRDSFLMVGTLEPRKGHEQVLEAYEQLWQFGHDVHLVIVGKQGWMVETLAKRLRTHPELNKRLFWLEGISDEYLEKIYAACTCLIAASFGEGFGLPLIEAAQHKLPIMARDIPVFHEVAGEHAHYFNAEDPKALAQAIEAWLELYKSNQQPKSDMIPWLTWKQSAARLAQICTGKEFQDAVVVNGDKTPAESNEQFRTPIQGMGESLS